MPDEPPMLRRVKRRLVGPVVGLLALALGAIATVSHAQAPAQPPGPPPVPVTATAAARRDVPILLRNIGAVQANQTAAIRTRVDGTLEEVFFTEGQDVRRGDKLAQIDPRPYRAALDQALARKAANEAALANARQDLARSTDLMRNQFAARQVVDTRTAQVAVLEANLRSDDAAIQAAQVNLDYTTIRAPFDGRVGLRQVDPGNVLRLADNTGVAIVTLSQIRPIVVVFTLPQDSLPVIRAAMRKGPLPVAALAPETDAILAEGRLLTVDNAVDPTTGTIKLKAEFDNANTALWPGQFVNVRLEVEIQRGVVTVPSIAVQRGPVGLYVYVVKDDSTVDIARVDLGQDDGKLAVIRSGLDEGARVVVAGQSRLRGGTRVTVSAPRPSG